MNILNNNWYCNRFIHLKKPIFSANHSGASMFAIPTTSRIQTFVTRYLVVLAWDFKTPLVCLNYRAKYKIVTEYIYITIQNSTHFIWIKHHNSVYWMLYPRTIQKYLIIASDSSFAYHRSLFTAKLRDGQLSNKIQYLRVYRAKKSTLSIWVFYIDRQCCKWDRTMNINK